MSNELNKTLDQRGQTYGDFKTHAYIAQEMKKAMQCGANWHLLDDDMKEALEMVCHKIGRITNGDPRYKDSWHDIIGYVALVEKRL